MFIFLSVFVHRVYFCFTLFFAPPLETTDLHYLIIVHASISSCLHRNSYKRLNIVEVGV